MDASWELICRGCLTDQDKTIDPYEKAKEVKSVGVCLSGGGSRSATFNLGILQGMARHGVLDKIDYLSTVSGGGYIHEFLAWWIDREELASVQQKLNPIPSRPGTAEHVALRPGRDPGSQFQRVAPTF